LQKQKLGPDHPHTLLSMYNLAHSYSAAGRAAEALKLREETLALQKQKLGPDHPHTLLSMYNLAHSYSAAGRAAEALKLQEETLALAKQKLGPNHPDTLNSMWGVIASLVDIKRTDEALPLIREVMKLAAQSIAAGKRPDPRLVPQMFTFLLQIAVEKRSADLAHEAAEGWEKLKRTDALSLYDSACYRAVTARLLKDESEAKIEADKAMEWLKKAVAAGWNNRAHTETDSDLDALRGRADFKALVASLPYIAPPPRAVR